jgi:hypothetical protein
MYTEYSKALNYFRSVAAYSPNTTLRDILIKFAEIRHTPNDIAAAKYLISSYHEYQDLLLSQANTYVR